MIEFVFFVTSEIVFFFLFSWRRNDSLIYLTQLSQMATHPYNGASFGRGVVVFLFSMATMYR